MGNNKYTAVTACRICGNTHLETILDLGEQMLTGVFPRLKNDTSITTGPLVLLKCFGENVCGLVQLKHSYDLTEMYGFNYGYRSGLNASMVKHLHDKVHKISSYVSLKPGDLIIDIGSNDSTTLQAYPKAELCLVGVDPTGIKFKSYYPDHIQLIPNFFSAKLIKKQFPNQKAKVITSFSMFYDLEDPMHFMTEIHEVLADDGIWVFEQSYMPAMLATNSFDTVCHEHLEFYSLKQIKWMTDRVGLKIEDVEFNDVNGGSFSITVSKSETFPKVLPKIQEILDQEIALGLDGLEPFEQFATRSANFKKTLVDMLTQLKSEGKRVIGIGASTKGNVLLQYCGIDEALIAKVGEVNPEKFDCFTPGSWIPIVKEEDILHSNPDYLLILPWHFKSFFLNNPKFKNLKMIFPLPEIEIVG